MTDTYRSPDSPGLGMTGSTEDLLSRIVRLSPKMSPAERRVADLVLSDMEFAVHTHTTDIASRAGVSAATVTRFCRSVGCRGLRELKLDLARILAVGDRYLHPRIAVTRTSEAVTEIVSRIHRSLDALVDQVSDETLKRAASVISGAKRVMVFGGGGGSSMVAMETENRLFRLGLSATHCNDAQLQLMMAATLTAEDVLIALSITGRYEPIIQATVVADQYGAHTIAVTAPESPLSRVASDVVPFLVEEPENILSPTPARYVLLALLDILAYEVAAIRGEAAMEPMRRIKYQLVNTRDGDDSKPLGD
ncbi:MAG: MurR/RpiR family transcriptional regulator [Chromatiales bacterium]|nr:MurR/RpiR family transcriptional regulator [Chromatiales bacterium]